MESTQKAQNQIICCEYNAEESHGTWVVIDATTKSLSELNIKSQKITLMQEPNEELSLDYTITRKQLYMCVNCKFQSENTKEFCHKCKAHTRRPVSDYQPYSHNSNLTLTFHNYIHNRFQGYSYEIEIKALIGDKWNPNRHVILFAYKDTRTRNAISIHNQPMYNVQALSSRSVIHVCASITRFKKNGEKHESFGQLLLENGFYSDVSLVVGEKTFKAHKHILSLKSKVFEGMFSHSMSENKDNSVEIEDLDADSIEEMLFYIYTSKTKNLAKIPQEVFMAAHKYDIKNLKSKCEEHLIFNLNCKNIADILHMVNLYELEDLGAIAATFIRENEKQMVKEDSFQKYLCDNIALNTIVYTLLLSEEHNVEPVKLKAFEFVKEHAKEMATDEEFMNLFDSHPKLMKSIFKYIHD